MQNKIIHLKNFGSNLNTRALADNIFSAKSGVVDLAVDFEGIATASPSFCHEMLTLLSKNKEIKVKFINASDDIKTQISKAKSSIVSSSSF